MNLIYSAVQTLQEIQSAPFSRSDSCKFHKCRNSLLSTIFLNIHPHNNEKCGFEMLSIELISQLVGLKTLDQTSIWSTNLKKRLLKVITFGIEGMFECLY